MTSWKGQVVNVFVTNSYKRVLLEKVAENKAKGIARSTFQELAAHCRIQKTYLSKVLNKDGHLTQDQLYLAGEFLKFTHDELDYLLLLHSLETSVVVARRKELKARIAKIQADNLQTEKHTTVRTHAKTTARDREAYYLDPLYSLIHMFLTIERYRQDQFKIAEALGLSTARLVEYLERLEEMGLIKFEKNKYSVVEDGIHLPAESELQRSYRTMMRLKALEKMSQLERDAFYSFSVVFSSDETVRAKIQASFLEFLNLMQKLVQDGIEKEIYQMNFDLVAWS
jgi:DNA-binding MarR family transcriptional regulator